MSPMIAFIKPSLLAALFLLLPDSLQGRAVLGRKIRSRQEVCDDTQDQIFEEESLGPSYAWDSLYDTAAFPIEVEDDDGFIDLLYVDIGILALLLLESNMERVDLENFDQASEFFGPNGEYTEEILGQHRLFQDFWQAGDLEILVFGLHSESLEGNVNEAIAIMADGFEEEYGVNITEADELIAANEVIEAIETELPNGYSNPILSYDGFYEVIIEDNGDIFQIMVLGDGSFAFDESVGLGEVGSDIFHAHEFAHAIQFILDFEDVGGNVDAFFIASDTETPDDVRDGELEADAMAAYALAHEQGRNFEVDLLLEASKASFFSGDCYPTDPDHHGTPLQRECATLWGADEGLDMSGAPVSMREFRNLFYANRDLILALDPSVCELSEPIPGGTASPSATTIPGGTASFTGALGLRGGAGPFVKVKNNNPKRWQKLTINKLPVDIDSYITPNTFAWQVDDVEPLVHNSLDYGMCIQAGYGHKVEHGTKLRLNKCDRDNKLQRWDTNIQHGEMKLLDSKYGDLCVASHGTHYDLDEDDMIMVECDLIEEECGRGCISFD